MVNHEPRHRPSLSAKGGRGGRKSESSECEASINQHNPSFEHRDRGTDADDAVKALATEERPWKRRECQEQAHRLKHQRGLWEQKKCNAAMRLDV